MTAAGAARVSGYSGDKVGIRQAGSRAARSAAVTNLLALAKAESGEGPDGVVGAAEAKRILSRLARGSDPNVRIKALESLARIDRDEREASAEKGLSHDEADSFAALVEVFGETVAVEMHKKMVEDLIARGGIKVHAPDQSS